MISANVGDDIRVPIPTEMARWLFNLPDEFWATLGDDDASFHRDGVTKTDVEAYIEFWYLSRTAPTPTPRMRWLVLSHLRGLTALVGYLPFEPLYGMCIARLAQDIGSQSSVRIAEMLGSAPTPFASVL